MGISLVTGATGFLGSHIVDRLVERGETVRALVRETSDTSYLQSKGIDFAEGDVTIPLTLGAAMKGVDTVYHAAATVTDWAPWSDFQSVTVEGTQNVFSAAVSDGVRRVLHVSSDAVYALSALKDVVTEESPLEKRFGWLDYYRRSKSVAESTARRFMQGGNVEVSIVRPGLLLGERDRAIFPGTVAFLRGGSATYIGSGHNRLPYVYAGDVAEACIQSATSDAGAGGIYNVASEETVTQRDIFDTIAEETGLRPPKRSMPTRLVYTIALAMEALSIATGRRNRPSMTRYGVNILALDYREDVSKAKRALGWEPTVPLKEAIRRTMEWRESHRAVPAGG
jgi:nucleoside-diphosphate-sugar epimerase